MKDSLTTAIREAVPVPAHVRAAAEACAADLLHGPQYAAMPKEGGWESFGEDDWTQIPSDLEGDVTPVYTGPVGDMLRAFIADLPSTMYADEDQEEAFADEPQAEEVDGETFEPAPYYEIGSSQIVEALFGVTISREFR